MLLYFIRYSYDSCSFFLTYKVEKVRDSLSYQKNMASKKEHDLENVFIVLETM